MLLEPVEKEIDGKTYILSKFPAVEGREIISRYSTSGFPNITDYKANETAMFMLLSYVAVSIDGRQPLKLTTRDLVNNHVKDWKTLLKIETEMMALNNDPLGNGQG